MAINPARLMGAIAKGEIVMPEGAPKSTQRLVLIAIVGRVDNDTGKIPDGTGDSEDDFRVPMGGIAGDVGHKATANALKPLDESEYVIIDRGSGRGERIGIRLGPKLMDEKQWPLRKRKAHGQNDKAKKSRRNDQAKPRQNDQAQHSRNDQASPYRSTPSIRVDDQRVDDQRVDDPGRQLGRDDPGRQLGSSNRSGEEQGIMEAFNRFYGEGHPLQGKHVPFIDVLRQASEETIRKLDWSFKARIQDSIWEKTGFPREIWKRQSTFLPPQPSTHDLD